MAFTLPQGLLVVLRRFSPQLATVWVVPLFIYHLSLRLQVHHSVLRGFVQHGTPWHLTGRDQQVHALCTVSGLHWRVDWMDLLFSRHSTPHLPLG